MNMENANADGFTRNRIPPTREQPITTLPTEKPDWRTQIAKTPSETTQGARALEKRLTQTVQILENRLVEARNRLERGSYPPSISQEELPQLRAEDEATIADLEQQQNTYSTAKILLERMSQGQPLVLERRDEAEAVETLLKIKAPLQKEQGDRERELDELGSIDPTYFLREFQRTRHEMASLLALQEAHVAWEAMNSSIAGVEKQLVPGSTLRFQVKNGEIHGCVVTNTKTISEGLYHDDLAVYGKDVHTGAEVEFVISHGQHPSVMVLRGAKTDSTTLSPTQWFDVTTS